MAMLAMKLPTVNGWRIGSGIEKL